ncbi:uncharacterized protein LOC131679674 [Topomyia yanbarensis]|uniref:uncharacterized protein LOC131679674 n=1 Tax=Topomyia yanbarensis TaxID=2498891 RepID=UPI00273AB78C|nr:uncharacterized protein LOC131679674 [Topomyia yanbarensis]
MFNNNCTTTSSPAVCARNDNNATSLADNISFFLITLRRKHTVVRHSHGGVSSGVDKNMLSLNPRTESHTNCLIMVISWRGQLNAVVDKIPKGDIKIYTGDLNAKVGSDNSDYECVIGRHGLGEMSENGELLAEFCGDNDMVIEGSLFPHRPVNKVTWVSRDGFMENQIDHICISRKWRRSLLDVLNKRSADVARRRSGVNTRRLEDAAVRRSIVDELENHAAEIPEGGSVEDQWTTIKNAFIATGENNLGAKAASRQRYSALEKEVKRSCRRDKRAWADSLTDEGEKAANTGDIRLLYDISRHLSGTKINATMPVKDTSGQLLTDRADQLKRWFEHFENLFQVSATPPTTRHDSPRVRRITRVNTEAPSLQEIETAIQSMKSNRAPGVDRISAEMLKADPVVSAQPLHQLFYNIWDTATFPADWMQGVLVKVLKKGDLTVSDNWRGIMLLCIVLKVLCKVILNRIQEKIDATFRRQQAGVRAGRSCADHIVTLRIILEKVNEFQEFLYLVFIDYEKAFDRITKILRGIFVQNIARWRLVRPHPGQVRQGCILSPLLFLIGIDEILIGAIDREPNRGLLWQPISMEHLDDFELADDVALLAQRRSDMQSKLDDLADRSSAAGLKINVNKTKSLDINMVNPSSFTVAGQAVENVECFQYLGSQMASDGGTKIDTGARIKKARAAFASFRNIWKHNQISRRTETRIFNSNVKSVLLYASETWCEPSAAEADSDRNSGKKVEVGRPNSAQGRKRNLQASVRLEPSRTSQQRQTHGLMAAQLQQGTKRSRRKFDLAAGQGDDGHSPRMAIFHNGPLHHQGCAGIKVKRFLLVVGTTIVMAVYADDAVVKETAFDPQLTHSCVDRSPSKHALTHPTQH